MAICGVTGPPRTSGRPYSRGAAGPIRSEETKLKTANNLPKTLHGARSHRDVRPRRAINNKLAARELARLDWKPDEEFLEDLAARAPWWLKEFWDDAMGDVQLKILKRPTVQGTLARETPHGRLCYLAKIVLNEAKKHAKRKREEDEKVRKIPPREPPGDSEKSDVFPQAFDDLGDDESLICVLLCTGYEQKQIAQLLGLSRPTVNRTIRRIREKGQANIQRMERKEDVIAQKYTDNEIYGFVDKLPDTARLGNDNLRRALERILLPLRLLSPLLPGGLNPLIPPGMRKQVQELIRSTGSPPKVKDIRDKAAKQPCEPLGATLDILEFARQLNKPYRWISQEESIRAIGDPGQAADAINKLLALLAAVFRLLAALSKKTSTRHDITTLVCDKLKDIATRFATQRGHGCSPFAPALPPSAPLGNLGVLMEQQAARHFKKNLDRFERDCNATGKRGCAATSLEELQGLVDSLVLLLDWKMFDAPGYLAPAIVEEAIEVALAANGPSYEKQNVFAEIGDLFFMSLWLSNVLAVANPGHEMLERLP
jgi:RNA polymerase sigma factor (sigma-70 family)